MIHLEDIAVSHDALCSVTFSGVTGRFSNPLLAIPVYRASLMLAAAAAMILGRDPGPLSSFEALPGRMSLSYENGRLIVDNANSGTNAETTIEAARYARQVSGNQGITLVIGQVAGDGAVCEGFAADQMLEAIDQICPDQVIWVGTQSLASDTPVPFVSEYSSNLDEALITAVRLAGRESIVLAVKTWR